MQMLTERQRFALGYDMFGNSPDLLAEKDKEEMNTSPGVKRASGEVVCEVCGQLYYDHPRVQGALWATRTCEGIVKL